MQVVALLALFSAVVLLLVVALVRQSWAAVHYVLNTEKVRRVIPVGLREKLGLAAPGVEWKPSPEGQERANLWATIRATFPNAPRSERRRIYFSTLRQAFRARPLTDGNRGERRRTIRGG